MNQKIKVIPVTTKRKGKRPAFSLCVSERTGKSWWSQGYMGTLGGTF